MWLPAAEKKEVYAALLLDLSSNFDIVNHDIFLKKLKSYNFSENSILKSYLEELIQVLQVETNYSEPELLDDFAVPQEIILRPLIFLIFNNDFPASAIEGDRVLCTDDDTYNVYALDVEELKAKIQRDLLIGSIIGWCARAQKPSYWMLVQHSSEIPC